MDSITDLFRKLVSEHGFEFFVVNDYPISDGLSVNVTIVNKNSFDYFIYFEIDYEYLGLIESDIQINLATKFKRYLQEIDVPFEISHYFEKNTYLIIATKYPKNTNINALFKKISHVEEDPYFFKKQIFYYFDEELSEIKVNDFDVNYSDYFNSVVSNIERYNSYIENNDVEYSFAIKMFEKFPFLKLKITENELLNLNQMINDKLSKKNLELIPKLLSLSNEKLINEWIESLGVSN